MMNATTSTINSRRPVPRVGDNLDRLLDLLDRARDEQQARARGLDDKAVYRLLLSEVVGEARKSA
jgi:hypothetical protein